MQAGTESSHTVSPKGFLVRLLTLIIHSAHKHVLSNYKLADPIRSWGGSHELNTLPHFNVSSLSPVNNWYCVKGTDGVLWKHGGKCEQFSRQSGGRAWQVGRAILECVWRQKLCRERTGRGEASGGEEWQNKDGVIEGADGGGDWEFPFIYAHYFFQMAAKLLGHNYLLSSLGLTT